MAPTENRYLAKELTATPAIEKNLHLGMQAESVISTLGKPGEDSKI